MVAHNRLDIPEQNIGVDQENFLLSLTDWSKEVAFAIAKLEKIELTENHWEMILFLQKFYAQYRRCVLHVFSS